jgi:hypothetical protein
MLPPKLPLCNINYRPLGDVLSLVKQNIRPRCSLTPLYIVHIPRSDQLPGQRLPGGTREASLRREPRRPGGLPISHRGHAADILISEIAARPRRCAGSGGRQAGEDIELAGARERRCAVEDEVQLARLAGCGGGDVEGRQRGDVGDDAVLEDLAAAGVEVDGAGPDGVLGDGRRNDDVGARGDGARSGDGGCEA